MQHNIFRFLICIVLISPVLSGNSMAQSCADVLKLCPPADKIYNKQSLARTYRMHPAQKLKIVHVFYGSTAYHINICKSDSLGQFHLQVIDDESGAVFWDNANDDYSSTINISFGSTKRIILEIEALNPEKFKKQWGCLGLAIRYHREESAAQNQKPEMPKRVEVTEQPEPLELPDF
ncbi:hypothetical protein SAMN06265379_101356 [Saccharicrinis carchari]|uniref:Uncharacterized protein n=1 Tax=Saccharicrinis carchari TaxID=1168039 RepID=A0A521ASN0_SACCC|nr:hypothetical protein [Saccharicrinis carchari]SMO37650.1 hypothetical protein SAMN06265379_101356 [Saccharicrinis carchari]